MEKPPKKRQSSKIMYLLLTRSHEPCKFLAEFYAATAIWQVRWR
jgi:hypothetical protein